MIRLTLVPYVLVRDEKTGRVVPHPVPSISSRKFDFESGATNPDDLLDFDDDVRKVIRTRDFRRHFLGYCYLVISSSDKIHFVRNNIVDVLAFNLVSCDGDFSDSINVFGLDF